MRGSDNGVRVKSLCGASAIALFSLAVATDQVRGQSVPETPQMVIPVSSAAADRAEFGNTRDIIASDTANPVTSPAKVTDDKPRLLDVHSGGLITNVVSISKSRLASLEATVNSLVIGDRINAPSALIELRDAFLNERVPAFDLGTGSGTGVVKDLKLSESFAASFERARVFGVRLAPEPLQRLPSTDLVAAAARTDPGFAAFSSNYAATIRSISAVLKNPGEGTRSSLLRSATVTRDSLIENWPALADDPQARDLAVRSLDGLRRQPELKAIYDVDTSFAPQTYEKIYQNALRLAVLTEASGRTQCSGLALVNGWILTAGHCAAGDLPELRIRLTGADGKLGPPQAVTRQWPEAETGASSGDTIDYVFLRAGAGLVAPTTVPPIPCLRERDASYQEPVIAVGFARDQELVYDNASVWYPYSLLPKAYKEVVAMTGVRLHRLSRSDSDPPARQNAFYKTEMASFTAAYRSTEGSGPLLRHFYRKNTTGVTSERPRFGFDTDTSHGDSGSPVFSRRDNCLVGVFVGGRPDNTSIEQASWLEHEFGTPMSQILKDVRKRRQSMSAADQADPDLVALFTSWDAAVRPDN